MRSLERTRNTPICENNRTGDHVPQSEDQVVGSTGRSILGSLVSGHRVGVPPSLNEPHRIGQYESLVGLTSN